MGEDDDDIPHGHLSKRHLDDPARFAAVGERRHPPGQCLKHTSRPAHRAGLERLPPGEHENDEHTGEPLAEKEAREDRHAGEEIGAKHPRHHLREKLGHEDRPADQEHPQEGEIGNRRREGPPCRQQLPQRRQARHLHRKAQEAEEAMDRQGHKHADGDRLIDGESPGRTAAGRWLAGRGGGRRGAAHRFGPLVGSTRV